jgi:hypothetical protein
VSNVSAMQEVGFDFVATHPHPPSVGLAYLLCLGSVGLTFLGRKLNNRDKPYSWVCYVLAGALIMAAWIVTGS